MIDHIGEIACAEAIVDVYHADTAGTGIKHGKQGGDTPEGGTVAHTGGYRNHRAVCQTANHACQSTLHARNGNDDTGTHNQIHVGKEPVHPGYAHIVQADNTAAQNLRCQSRFFRHGNITGAAGGDYHISNAIGLGKISDQTHGGILSIVQRVALFQILRCLRGHSGD